MPGTEDAGAIVGCRAPDFYPRGLRVFRCSTKAMKPSAWDWRRARCSGFLNQPWSSRRLLICGRKTRSGYRKALRYRKICWELLDGPQGAPDAGAQADEAHGPALEALGELEHVYEIFEDAGEAAVVFGRDDDEAGGLEHGVGEGMEGRGLFGVGGGEEDFLGQLREV